MAEQIDIWVVHPLKLIYRNSTFPKTCQTKNRACISKK